MVKKQIKRLIWKIIRRTEQKYWRLFVEGYKRGEFTRHEEDEETTLRLESSKGCSLKLSEETVKWNKEYIGEQFSGNTIAKDPV